MSETIDTEKVQFQPFDWVSKRNQVDTGGYVMLSNIRDLASGAALALQIVERAELQKGLHDVPIIDGSDSVRFLRMSIAAMNVIEGMVDEHFDDMSCAGADKHCAATLGGAA